MSAADGLATLLEIQATPEFRRDGGLRLESAVWVGGDLRLALTVWTGHPRRVAQRWELDCRSVRDHRLRLGRCDRLAVASEHVLLWPHSQPRGQTYFVAPTPEREVGAVVGALYRRHAELVGGWFGFERFMNRGGLAWVLGLRAGSLAYGPAPLTLAYAEVLGSLGYRTSHVVEHALTDGPLVVLTWGESYVVAAGLEARRLRRRGGTSGERGRGTRARRSSGLSEAYDPAKRRASRRVIAARTRASLVAQSRS